MIAYITNPKFWADWETDLEEAEIASAETWLIGRNPDYGEVELAREV